ncbi:MAG TPA: hypothetical protein VL068_00750, partial [Microthrixaceae bacterium]|nr:hypothetical protein [Microthrixaceae bacterium]
MGDRPKDGPEEKAANPTIRPVTDQAESVLWNQVKLRLLLAGVAPDEVDRIDTAHQADAAAAAGAAADAAAGAADSVDSVESFDDTAPDGPAANASPLVGEVTGRLLAEGPIGDRAAIEAARSHVLWGVEKPITIDELAQRSGLDVEVCRKARMLLGLADPGDKAVCQVQEVEVFQGFASG